ncbi:hypothetical protein AB0H63_25585 [Micromonospora echinospora]|uniref:hypothetical protein n=1 Tax=Micromonospora echinospora TaxID=1877 RepID=UPI0033C029ED
MFDRLSYLMDNWNDKERQAEAPEVPDALQGELETLVANVPVFLRHQAELESLAGALSTYVRNPDRLSVEDEALMARLGRLRGLLEEVYGQALSFDGESARAKTGTRVEQRVDTVIGTVLGVDGSPDGAAHVVQEAKTVEAGGWMVGVRTNRRR